MQGAQHAHVAHFGLTWDPASPTTCWSPPQSFPSPLNCYAAFVPLCAWPGPRKRTACWSSWNNSACLNCVLQCKVHNGKMLKQLEAQGQHNVPSRQSDLECRRSPCGALFASRSSFFEKTSTHIAIQNQHRSAGSTGRGHRLPCPRKRRMERERKRSRQGHHGCQKKCMT